MSPRTSTQGTRAPYDGLRNPVGTHVQVCKGLVAGALAQADALGCETIQVFAGNPRGWALSNGDPKVDAAFREATSERGMRVFIHGAAATPTPLIEALTARTDLEGMTLYHIHTDGPAPFAEPENTGVETISLLTFPLQARVTLFRSLRFGINEAHGRGVAIQLNHLLDAGAVRALDDGRFDVDPARIREAVTSLTADVMTLQAEGSYAKAAALIDRLGVIRPEVRRAVVAANTLVSQAESIRTFRILAQPFTEEHGLLTPSL